MAIDLKIGAFQPEHKGKMEFYLEALDAQERMDGENPPIGIERLRLWEHEEAKNRG